MSLRLASVALFPTLLFGQQTWIVDDTPGVGVDFTSLPIAVATVASGDVLIVRAGHYAPFQISGKALTILGDGAATCVVDGAPSAAPTYIGIDAVPPGTVFRLSGISVRRDLGGNGYLIDVSGNATSGTVVLSDVIAAPATTSSSSYASGLRLTGTMLHALRSEFRGGWSLTGIGGSFSAGAPGVTLQGAAIGVFDACTMRGGSTAGPTFSLQHGGAGLAVTDSTGVVTHSSAFGGDVLTSSSTLIRAGNGVDLYGTAKLWWAGDANDTILGGNAMATPQSIGGSAVWCDTQASGRIAGAVVLASGTGTTTPAVIIGAVTTGLPAWPRTQWSGTIKTNGALDATAPATLAVHDGTPGGLYITALDLAPGYLSLPDFMPQPQLLTPFFVVHAFGLLDASGATAETFVPAALTPPWLGVSVHAQAVILDPVNGTWAGSSADVRRFE